MDINLEKCKTSAQAVTTICYTEATRNLNYRIECKNLEDFQECIRIIRGYNEFDHEIVNMALDRYATFKRFYSLDNPNNGSDLLKYDIGRENSVVMYVKYFNFGSSNKIICGKEVLEFTKEMFETNMKAFAKEAKADECDFDNDGCYDYCRLWWD